MFIRIRERLTHMNARERLKHMHSNAYYAGIDEEIEFRIRLLLLTI